MQYISRFNLTPKGILQVNKLVKGAWNVQQPPFFQVYLNVPYNAQPPAPCKYNLVPTCAPALPIFWSKWGQTMLGQIGLIRGQSTILSYLRSPSLRRQPKFSHVTSASIPPKTGAKFSFVTLFLSSFFEIIIKNFPLSSIKSIIKIMNSRSPLHPFNPDALFSQAHKIFMNFSKSSKNTFLPQP